MTTIYLIRHAEAEGNLYRIAQGQHESSLTDRGWRQVKALEHRFAGVHIDAVYASDLYRTRATATAIYRAHGLPLRRCPGLREICVGDWEGRTWGDIARATPQAMADFGGRMDRWSIPGAETPAEVLARVRRTVEDIARENAAVNGLDAARFQAVTGNVLADRGDMERLARGGYDVVLANIVADVIIPLAPVFPRFLRPGGTVICSGILDVREPEVRLALDAAGLSVSGRAQRDDWVCLTLRRGEEGGLA